MEEKYLDTLRRVNIQSICTDSKFGELNFESVVQILKQMTAEIVELEDLDFRTNLTQAEINQIEGVRNILKTYINQIENFTITQPNASQTRDDIIRNLQSYYQNSFAGQVRQSLLYLRDKVRLNTKSSETEYRKLASDLQKLITEVKVEKQKLEKDKISIEQGKGIVSAKYLSSQFDDQSNSANTESNKWQKRALYLSIALVVLIVLLMCGYISYIKSVDPTGTIEYSAFSATIIACIFFYLKVVLRNYNITKHIATGNKHRANVASTIEGFLAQANQDPDLKSALLKEGSTALFQADSTGYLTKDQIEVSTPVKEVINTIMHK